MRPQKRPFTVTVKRRKRSPDGPASIFSDTPELAEMMRSARQEADGEDGNGVAPATNADSDTSRSAGTEPERAKGRERQPRILDVPAVEKTPPPQAEADEPQEPPRRRRGRPRRTRRDEDAVAGSSEPELDAVSTSAATTSDEFGGNTDDPDLMDENASWDGLAETSGGEFDHPAAAPIAMDLLKDVDLAGLSDPRPVRRSSARGENGTMSRLERRRAMGLKLGERWRRHLPRWSR